MSVEARGIHRRTDFELTPELIARFSRRVERQDGCWLWRGAVRNGYGAIKHHRRVLSTHVVAYRIHCGRIPPDRLVCHHCDNRICCNPAHLYLGTFADNARDMQERRAIGAARGEEMPGAVLTDDLVRTIIRLWQPRTFGARRIAKQLGINENTVKGVLLGRTWKHVGRRLQRAGA